MFNSQKKKAKAFVLKTMKGEAEHDFHGERSENEIEFSPFARQLTITKTKKLIRRHTKKLNKSKVHKNAGELLSIDWMTQYVHSICNAPKTQDLWLGF